MNCANCGRDVSSLTVVHGLVLCSQCMSQMKETEQLPRPKVVEPNFRRVARRRHYTRDWR